VDVVKVYMRKIQLVGLTLLAYFVFTTAANAQSACPPDMVCLTPAAARAALEAGDRAKALEAEIAVKDQAIDDLKKLLADARIQYAECKGETTILKQRAVSDAALIELLSKMVRPKKVGINLF
jgi:hypothetical protein